LNNYFIEAARILNDDVPNAVTPSRTFVASSTAFHLNRDPNIRRLSVDEVAGLFKLPDLRPSLADHIQRIRDDKPKFHNMAGRRNALADCELPVDKLQVWYRVRMQSKSYHDPNKVLPPQTVNSSPPSGINEFGQYDTVLVNIDPSKIWPKSGLHGELSSGFNLI
jgi:hypothetical protein